MIRRFSFWMTLSVLVLGSSLLAEQGVYVPRDYTPDKSWPVIVVCQNDFSQAQKETLPYIVCYDGRSGIYAQVFELAKKYNIDPYRVYATGFSRSGHGLLERSWMYPDWLAAQIPVCNDLRPKAQYKIPRHEQVQFVTTPTLLLYGDRDTFIKTGKILHEIMEKAGAPVWWDTFPGGHSPSPIYNKNVKRLTDFFEKHVLDPYPKRVVKVVYKKGNTRAYWVDAHADKTTIGKAYPNYRVEVRDGNVIDVKASDGITGLVLYLNEKLVDMQKPVTVTSAGKELYKGKATPALRVQVGERAFPEIERKPRMWEQLEALRSEPSETGARDWLYTKMRTAFKSPFSGKPVEREIWLDMGFKAADGPAKAKIVATSKSFNELNCSDAEAGFSRDLSNLEKKLPLTASVTVKRFGLAGNCAEPSGSAPVRLVSTDEGKSGEAVVVMVKLINKGEKDIQGLAKLHRTPYFYYRFETWPKQSGSSYYTGFRDFAGPAHLKQKSYKMPYQMLGFLMLSPEGGDAVKAFKLPISSRFRGVQRAFTVKAGTTMDLPLLLISADSPDAKAKKPVAPDLAGVVASIKTDLLGALKTGK